MDNKDDQSTPREPAPVEEVDAIVKEFAEELRRDLRVAKERAIQALANRNRLRRALAEEEARTQALISAAGLKPGNHPIVRTAEDQARRAPLEAELAKAELEADAERQRFIEFEQRLRGVTAERLSMISRWNIMEIEARLNAACEGIAAEGANEAFERARERIRQLNERSRERLEQAEAGLRRSLAELEDPRRGGSGTGHA
jgi:hypothetical protein